MRWPFTTQASRRSASSAGLPSSRRTPGSPPDSAQRQGHAGHDASDAVVHQAAALVLAYPDEALLGRLDLIEAALDGSADGVLFAPVLAHLRGDSLRALQSFHVQEFDLSRRHSLHLSYWTDGDTRRRGAVLAEIKQVYRDSGLVVDTGGELPDYLPMVLEFVVHDSERGAALLKRFRASLELIRLELAADDLPHAGVLTALCNRLPGESPRTRAEVQARFGQTQPAELVGLELAGYGPGDPGVRRGDGKPVTTLPLHVVSGSRASGATAVIPGPPRDLPTDARSN